MSEQPASSPTSNGPSLSSSYSLPRWLGFFGVLFLGLAGLGLARSSNFPLEIIPGRWPGINLVIVIGIALIAGLLFTFTFSKIGSVVRRPAADYVLTSRLISPPLAFISSWVFAITLSLFAGGVIGFFAQKFIPDFFKTLGTVFGIQELLPMADATTSPQVAILIGTVVIIVAFLTVILPPKTFSALLRTGFILVLISWGILLLQLLLAQDTTFTQSYDRVFGSGTYAQHIEQAYQYGLETSAPSMQITLLVGLFSSFYLFFGASLSAQAASEIKKPSKSLVPGSIVAVFLAGIIILISVIFLQRVVPTQFLAAQSYLAQKNVEVTGLTLTWLPFYAAISRPVLGLVVAVGISWIYLSFLFVQVLIYVLSRIILAWARDRIIPARICFIHPRQQTPLLAILIAAVAVQIGLIDSVQGGVINSLMHLAVFLAVSQILPVLALVLYPVLGKQVEGKIIISRVNQIITSLFGLATLGYLIWIIAAVFIYPFRLQEISPGTFLLLGILITSGLCFYLLRWIFLKRQGISLSDSFKSMPSEE